MDEKWTDIQEKKLDYLEEKIPLISRSVIVDTEKNLRNYVAKGLIRNGTILIATRKE